jgi:nucleotide-binding universal stress UspA family protein
MSYKHIVALAVGEPFDRQTLAFSAWLALEHGARVTVVPAYPDAAASVAAFGVSAGGAYPQEVFEALSEAMKTTQAEIEQVCRDVCEETGLTFGPGGGEPRLVLADYDRPPTFAVARHLALADLVVVAQGLLTGSDRHLIGQILFAERAPLLIARGDPESLSGVAAIAWDGSAHAGRAVRQALPLIGASKALLILQAPEGRRLDTDANPETLNAYLRAHDLGEGRCVSAEGSPEGEALIRTARANDVDLLIAGAFGRPQLAEYLFGGATRSFMKAKDGPSLLLMH